MDFKIHIVAWYMFAAASGYIIGALPLGALVAKVASRQPRLATLLCASADAAKVAILYFIWFYNSRHYWDDFIILESTWVDRLWREIEDATSQTLATVACASAVAGAGHPFIRQPERTIGVAAFVGLLIASAWPLCAAFLIVWGVMSAAIRRDRPAIVAAALATPVCAGIGYPYLVDMMPWIDIFEDGPILWWWLSVYPTDVGFIAISIAAVLIAWRAWTYRKAASPESAG